MHAEEEQTTEISDDTSPPRGPQQVLKLVLVSRTIYSSWPYDKLEEHMIFHVFFVLVHEFIGNLLDHS